MAKFPSNDSDVTNHAILRPVIVGLGEVLWDIDEKNKKQHLGGAPANFTYHANQLGACGFVVSSIGKDDFGNQIVNRFRDIGLSAAYLQRDDRPTGTVTFTTDEKGKPNYDIVTNVAWDFLQCNDELLSLAREADAVCFGSLAQRSIESKRSIHAFLKATRKNCLRVFDINLRQNYFNVATIEESLAVSEVLKLNDEELPVISQLLSLPTLEIESVAELITRYSLRMVALTRGANGSTLYGKHWVSQHNGHPPTTIVDTVGAGDSFTAALILGLLRVNDLDRIHDHASRLASFICSQAGATPKIPASLLT